MLDQTTIGFGLLGAGLIAPFHARSIKETPGCKLVAIADPNAERAGKAAGEFGCRACASLDEMLADPSIHVINVLTPNHLHRDAAIAAARAGRHVLTEKPPAMSLADTDAMIAAADAAKVKLGVVLQCRVRKPIRAMREALSSGRFGRVLRADAVMKWFRTQEYYRSDAWRSSRRSGAGVTIQHAFHYIDLLSYLLGPASRVSAAMSNVAHPGVDLEDTLEAAIDFHNGARAGVYATTALWPGVEVRIEIYGERGAAVMVGERMETWKFRDERPEDEAIRALGRENVKTAAGGPADFDFADHRVVIEAMADAARGKSEPLITARDARPTLELTLAMYRSARVGDAVELPLRDERGVWE